MRPAAVADLVFIRHAHIACSDNGDALMCGRHDVPLSPSGLAQVESLRYRLSVEPPFDAVYSSPLRRALQTSAAARNRQPRRLRSLAEICCGRLDGMPIAAVKRNFPDVWARNEAQDDENFCWPGGESYRRFRNRVLRAVMQIARAHAGQRVLMVTHAGVINQVLGTIAGQSAARWSNFRPHNASITRVLWSDSGADVERFDDYVHLSTASTHPHAG